MGAESMKNWRDSLISPDMPILRAIEIIDRAALQIALVIDQEGRLVGSTTDGDIRRGILKGYALSKPVSLVMNRQPVVAQIGDSRDRILQLMREKMVRQIPLLDESRMVAGVETIDDLMRTSKRSNWVVLMAGGSGSRLRPLTYDCPKPLLKIGERPLLEIILQNFINQGFQKFFISVNYKAEMFIDYFGDGSKWGAEIGYLHERQKMGTAGSLGLLPGRPEESMVIMNSDLLTKINFGQLLDFHQEQKAQATMCVREYDIQVPYGVVQIQNQNIYTISEKPTQSFFVNAGVYVLEPGVLELLPREAAIFDMTDLFNKLIRNKDQTCVFPVREYWLDIGHMDDLNKAQAEFSTIFS